MARQLAKYYDLVDTDAQTAWHEEWLAEWLDEVYEHPARLIVEISRPLEAGHAVSVVAIAETAPPFWGLCFVGEELTTHTAVRLTTALLKVKRLLGLDLHEALAFLIHEYLFHFDLRGAAREAKKSILVEGPWEQLGVSDPDLQERLSVLRRKPVWQLQAVLDCWAIYGGQFPTRFLDNPGFLPKAVSYLMIPPIFSADISTERAKQLLVPVLVELVNKPFLDSILAAKREGNRAGILMDFGALDEQRQLAGTAEHTVFSQENDSQSGFTHSPDFRSVCLRGEEFSLTPHQAQVIECLYKAYKNRSPEMGQDRLIVCLELKSRRLRDIFKSRPNAWRKLIVPGATRGSYRLNL
jgi:hypothetical protein